MRFALRFYSPLCGQAFLSDFFKAFHLPNRIVALFVHLIVELLILRTWAVSFPFSFVFYRIGRALILAGDGIRAGDCAF